MFSAETPHAGEETLPPQLPHRQKILHRLCTDSQKKTLSQHNRAKKWLKSALKGHKVYQKKRYSKEKTKENIVTARKYNALSIDILQKKDAFPLK